jgi:hypothetical protein
VIVALYLEGYRLALAEVDDAGVLARALEDPRAGCRQPAEKRRGMLIGAVLRPQQREDGELEMIRVAAEQLLDTGELPVRQAEGAVERLFRDRRQGPDGNWGTRRAVCSFSQA